LSELVHALLTWLVGGSALAALIKVATAISTPVVGFIYWRYVG